ncbi:MAG: HAMP domain-containing sensor histidine kinase [Candidatus Thermoplasmatota archaeon]|nr:HAMP domain-containing sensor histidine kinase [Candidatus Thermoplasmatota archaeon]
MSDNKTIIRKLEEEIENISRFPDENPHSVIRVSFEGELLFANSSARSALIKNFDYEGSLVEGSNSERFGKIFESVRRAIDSDETYSSETHIIGGRIYACAFVPIEEHEYVNVYGTDITDSQKEIEGLARFPEENPHSVIRISGEGEVIFANAPAKTQILKKLGVRVGQKVPDEIYSTVKETLGSGDYLDADHNLGGRIFACTFVPVVEHSYVNVYGVDITEKINAQEEAEEANQELIQAEKMSSLGIVISGIVHEIRNPLQVIMALSESIVDDDDLPRIQDDAQEIIDASHRISDIVSDLSTHARDARTLGESTINLNDIADKSMEISKHTRNLKSVKIVKDYAKSPIVIGSTSELTQIITNFVNNGVDAMNGKGELRLSTSSTKETHSISVTDNGSGMDEVTQKKIFDPFFTTKDPGKGTGLGLHVVRKIVEKHGAKLNLKSELGKGTTFTVIFSHKSEA